MEQIYHLGATTAAGILSAAPIDYPTIGHLMIGHLTIWAWFLIAVMAAVCTSLQKQTQCKPKSVPVLSPVRRPIRRAAPRSPRR